MLAAHRAEAVVLVPIGGAIFIFTLSTYRKLCKTEQLGTQLNFTVDKPQVMCFAAKVAWGMQVHTSSLALGGIQMGVGTEWCSKTYSTQRSGCLKQ